MGGRWFRFLPLVIFTVKKNLAIWLIANVALYCLVLALGGKYLLSLAALAAAGARMVAGPAFTDRGVTPAHRDQN